MDIATMLELLGKGALVSLEIFFVTMVGSLILGLLLCLVRMSKFVVFRLLAKFYISVMRGTPLMLQLFVVYFGPYYIFNVNISPSYKLMAVFIGFVLNYAAYFAEIYRAGIESIPIGQYEAAKLLGYGRVQTFFYIIMPQVVKRIIPPVTNETITLVKDTSLAFTLAVAEMFTIAKQIAAADRKVTAFVLAGIMYYVFNLLVAGAFAKLEKKLSYYR
ncbi:MAG: amino acid ABC transporter permease [Lachnospiraceae bacterium]|nr:amino acid ABC transporter permease [Lachnospiraceae bacterium]